MSYIYGSGAGSEPMAALYSRGGSEMDARMKQAAMAGLQLQLQKREQRARMEEMLTGQSFQGAQADANRSQEERKFQDMLGMQNKELQARGAESAANRAQRSSEFGTTEGRLSRGQDLQDAQYGQEQDFKRDQLAQSGQQFGRSLASEDAYRQGMVGNEQSRQLQQDKQVTAQQQIERDKLENDPNYAIGKMISGSVNASAPAAQQIPPLNVDTGGGAGSTSTTATSDSPGAGGAAGMPGVPAFLNGGDSAPLSFGQKLAMAKMGVKTPQQEAHEAKMNALAEQQGQDQLDEAERRRKGILSPGDVARDNEEQIKAMYTPLLLEAKDDQVKYRQLQGQFFAAREAARTAPSTGKPFDLNSIPMPEKSLLTMDKGPAEMQALAQKSGYADTQAAFNDAMEHSKPQQGFLSKVGSALTYSPLMSYLKGDSDKTINAGRDKSAFFKYLQTKKGWSPEAANRLYTEYMLTGKGQ